ncbi:hypothetical protein SK128_004792 [Halocaridina rubra]|uniref:Ionotropic glutamate receptor L-glutamate and glycine-binding domain-containing protein n=1 Tax=Halocaridina rubra TaxID=373956 RepID=A0AAN9FTN0_HALRR
MRGHRIKIVGVPTFPHNNVAIEMRSSGPFVTMLDSLDKRMLDTASALYNFTYEFTLPEDKQFGIPQENGSWTGMVGAIQRGIADSTTAIANNPGRNQIFDYTRAYVADPVAIVSPKPQLLQEFYLILRPFTGDVWAYLLISVLLWGVIFWLFQKASIAFTGYHMSPNEAILYSWSILIQHPPASTPSNISAQMMLGWWLLACIAMTTAYNSSLVSHLTVQTKTKPIDSWEDLLHLPNWKWGLETRLSKSTVYTYMKEHQNPNMKYIFRHLEIVSMEDGLKKILQGGYSLLIQHPVIDLIIASYHTDDLGRNPYYIGVKGQTITMDFGWGECSTLVSTKVIY